MPGAFFDRGPFFQYVVSGYTDTIAAYDISSPSGSSPIWTYVDTETGCSGPTIDPSSGDIYVFRSTRLIKLTATGSLIWESDTVGSEETGYSYGALSRDGNTFYYQTGNNTNTGQLYAFNTTDGSIKWVYNTNASGNCFYGGPVVSNNGLVFVSNGASTPSDNKLYCIRDGGVGLPVLQGTFDMSDEYSSGGPSFAIGPEGVVYVDGWNSLGGDLLYAFKTRVLFPSPCSLMVEPFYSTAYFKWASSAPDTAIAGYLAYRCLDGDTFPLEPTKYIGPRTEFSDYGLIPGEVYCYKITSCNNAGYPNSYPAEVCCTLETDSSLYSSHANLELLMVIYTEGWTPTEVEEYVNGSKKAIEFYWRNSKARINLDVTWFYIDAPIPATDGSYGPIIDDLRTRGIRDHQYDLLYTIGYGLGPCLGGYVIFGSTCASLGIACGVPYPGKNPDVNYTVTWCFTHEIHHAIDLLVDRASAADLLYCHFPWNYPDPLGGTLHMDCGTHYDGISGIMRLYDDYFGFNPPYDGYIECIDADHDSMPDHDPRVPIDEDRFGSNSSTHDSDGDELSDIEEFYRYNFTGTYPDSSDSDGDGIPDGSDNQPLYNIPNPPEIHAYTGPSPIIDGIIEGTPPWFVLSEGYYFTQNTVDFSLTTYATWDSVNLYLSFESSRELHFKISLDGSGELGRFESDIRHPEGVLTPHEPDSLRGYAFADVWGNGNHLYTYYGDSDSIVEIYGVTNIIGSEVASTESIGTYYTEIKIPKIIPHGCAYVSYPDSADTVRGLRLRHGQVIGLNVTFSNLSGASGSEFSGIWTSLFETHSYVDFMLDTSSATSISETELNNKPIDFSLFPTYPNPFNRGVSITYSLSSSADIVLDIYNVSGRQITELKNGYCEAGTHEVVWKTSETVSSGIYFIRLKVDEYELTKRVVYLK